MAELTLDDVDGDSFTSELGLSLADRACIALARRLGSGVATADQAWSGVDVGVQITMSRSR